MKGYLTMSTKEAERINVMENLLAKRIKQKHAARELNVSVRQIRRILKRYKKEGKMGLIHGNRGKISNRKIPEAQKEKIVSLIGKYYPDFGPTFTSEKLKEIHALSFSDETIRKIMIDANLWGAKKRKITNLHPYRERRTCVGELIQLDGSPHHWFEDRANPCTLVAFIDDATSRIMDGLFVDYEGTWTLFEAVKHYLQTHGKPLAFYVDKHSTFKINRQATIEEELKDKQAQSQFTRAMNDLGIEVIFANSPQAKGRVERLFETLQDRLVKELRLVGITDKNKATQYFRQRYLPQHNSKFAVLPKEKANLHRKLLFRENLEKVFTLRSTRRVSKDLIVQYKNTKYELTPDNGQRYTLRKTAITVIENRQGIISFSYKDKYVPYQVAIKSVRANKAAQVVSSKEFTERQIQIPKLDHPWRQVFYQH